MQTTKKSPNQVVYISEQEAAKLAGLSSEQMEKFCRESQSTQTKVRSMPVSTGGVKSTIYHKDDLLNYIAAQRAALEAQARGKEMADRVEQTLRTLAEMVRREIYSGSVQVSVELEAGHGPNRIWIELGVGEAS